MYKSAFHVDYINFEYYLHLYNYLEFFKVPDPSPCDISSDISSTIISSEELDEGDYFFWGEPVSRHLDHSNLGGFPSVRNSFIY